MTVFRPDPEGTRERIGPGGQLVLPMAGVSAQMGLDGRSYRPNQGPAGAADEPLLGTLRELSRAPANPEDFRELRLERQRTVWDLLGEKVDFETGEMLRESERPAKCCKVRFAPKGLTAQEAPARIVRSESGGWSMRNVVTCGSSHVCAVCSERNAQQARVEVSAALEKHLGASLYNDAWMLTLTLPHGQHDKLSVLVGRLREAWDLMTKSSGWRRFKKTWGLVGALRVFDSTFGKNGFHPHWHVALFVERAQWWSSDEYTRAIGLPSSAPIQPLRSFPLCKEEGRGKVRCKCTELCQSAIRASIALELSELWCKAADRVGAVEPAKREAFAEFGCHLGGAGKAAEYFTKWGLADEVTQGAKKNTNHWGLLDAFKGGDMQAGAKFAEYYYATKGLPILTGLAKLRKYLSLEDADVSEHGEKIKAAKDAEREFQGLPPRETVDALELEIPDMYFGRAVALGWAQVFAFVDRAHEQGEEPQAALIWILTLHQNGKGKAEHEPNGKSTEGRDSAAANEGRRPGADNRSAEAASELCASGARCRH